MQQNSQLVVAPGGSIVAQGDIERGPIVFEPLAGEGAEAGYWKGIAILGCGPVDLTDSERASKAPSGSPEQLDLRGPDAAWFDDFFRSVGLDQRAGLVSKAVSENTPFACDGGAVAELEDCDYEGHACIYGTKPGSDVVGPVTEGKLDEVKILYAGSSSAGTSNAQSNALSVAGVSRPAKDGRQGPPVAGFEIGHVRIEEAKDDCAEFFGGNVDVQRIDCHNVEDDGLDLEDGYAGVVTDFELRQDEDFTDGNCSRDRNGIEVGRVGVGFRLEHAVISGTFPEKCDRELSFAIKALFESDEVLRPPCLPSGQRGEPRYQFRGRLDVQGGQDPRGVPWWWCSFGEIVYKPTVSARQTAPLFGVESGSSPEALPSTWITDPANGFHEP